MSGIRGWRLPIPARPTVRATVMRPVRAMRAPVQAYNQRVTDLPIVGGQILLTLDGTGAARGQVGPTGLGTMWYPASVSLDSSIKPFDTSTVTVYVGPSLVPTTVIGTLALGGNGVIALALPSLSPGLYIIIAWTGGTPGSRVSANVTGTMSALTRGA